MKQRDLTGKVVVDVGAYVGDSALAFARRGATVHAFEPSVTFCGFIRRNVEVNGFAGKIRLHEVGLSDRVDEVTVRNDQLRFVEGVTYVLEHLPKALTCLSWIAKGPNTTSWLTPAF